MKNRIKLAAVAVTAAAVLAGCGRVPEGVATEPMRPAETVAVETTAPAETRYQFGDIVWTVEQWPDGTMHTCRHAVVEHAGNVVIVTMAIGETAEDIRWGLPMALESWAGMDPSEYLEQIPAAECFPSEEAAMAEIARLTADAFEEYWGCE